MTSRSYLSSIRLHGGSASCYYPIGYDEYGGLFASWSLGLATHLDPYNTNVMDIEGQFLSQQK
jgi:hypothetical protein